MKKYREFVAPYNAADEEVDPMADLLATFGVKEEEEESKSESEEPETQEPETQDPPSDVPQEEPKKEEDDEAGTSPVKHNKQNEAFAQMRIQNKQYADMLKGIAGVLGVQATDQDTLMTALNEKVISAQAKQQGVPAEFLQEFKTLKAQVAAYTEAENKKNAYLGFQRLKDTFSLDNAAVNAFADDLIAEGINPFVQDVDLESIYLKRNYKTMLQKAIEQGVQQEAARAAKAAASGVVPGKQTGEQDEADAKKINTVQDLNTFLDKLSK